MVSLSMLTDQQQKIFDFICEFTRTEGYPPSYSDIALFFGYSTTAAVQSHLTLIEKKGYIRKLGKARGIQILKANHKTTIPIVGRISAGTLQFAMEEDLGTIDDIQELKQKEGRIALKVRGDSMINAHIADGDIAIIEINSQIKDGDIVAVLIESEATLKRIFFEKNRVILKPENSAYKPLEIKKNDADARIVGKFIALVRVA
jgi:repressor LexA